MATTTHQQHKDGDTLLRAGQWFLIGLVIILSVHTRRWVVWEVDLPHIFIGYRAALLFAFNFPLVLLMGVFIARLADDPFYGESVSDALNDIITLRYGGVWWLLLLVWIGLSSLWANTPELARFGVLQTAFMLGTAILVAQTVRQGDDVPLLWLFCGGAVTQSLIAIAQMVHGAALGLGALGELQWDPNDLFGYGETMMRGYGLTAHPNILAGYVVIGLFAAITLIQRYGPLTVQGVLAGGALVVLILGLLVTLSRTGLAAALVPFVVFLLLQRHALRRLTPTHWLMLGGGVIVGVMLVIVVLGDTLAERNFGLQDTAGVTDRVMLGYNDTWDVLNDNVLLGAGENNLMVEVGHNILVPNVPVILPAHNAFLVLWAELGLVGLLLFLLICGTVLITLFNRPSGPLLIWTLAFLAWTVIMALDYYPWLDYRGRLLTLWIMGLWWGYMMRAKQDPTVPRYRSSE